MVMVSDGIGLRRKARGVQGKPPLGLLPSGPGDFRNPRTPLAIGDHGHRIPETPLAAGFAPDVTTAAIAGAAIALSVPIDAIGPGRVAVERTSQEAEHIDCLPFFTAKAAAALGRSHIKSPIRFPLPVVLLRAMTLG